MIRDILLWPHSTLKKKSAPVENFNSLAPLVYDMFDTMDSAGGVGLAAVQVGELHQLFVMRDPNGPGGYRCCFNPKILFRSPEKDLFAEGCLSIPGVQEDVMRHVWVEVTYEDMFGIRNSPKLHGLQSQIFQHELDHLYGKMYPDRMDCGARDRLRNRIKKARRGL